MTRETKIGLLVGLAFIIVIGILLSDHLTSSNDPPPAALAPAGNSVRDTIRTPGGTQPPVMPVVVAPQVTPERPVLTQADLEAQRKAQEIVRVGGPAVPAQPVHSQVTRNTATEQQPVATAMPVAPVTPVAERTAPVTTIDHPVAAIAAQNNEPIETVTPSRNDRPVQPVIRAGNTSGMAEYTVKPGDNLTKIALQMMGSASKANIEAIIRANPSLQTNPDRIIVGKTYKIPTSASVAVSTPTTPAVSTPVAAVQQNNVGEFWYTIKEGDTLTRIAREQLGQNESVIPALVELNRDIIKDPNSIPVNARIRLPSRPVAQIN